MKKVKDKKVVKRESDVYHVDIKVLGKHFTSEGISIKEALSKLDVSIAKGVSILRIEKGVKSQERILPAMITAGVFGLASPTMKEIRLKQLVSRFHL